MVIYGGNYKKWIIIPVVLIGLSLWMIPNIQLGREFMGGLIIKVTLDKPVDKLPIQGDVRQLSSPSGVLYEITTDIPNNINRLDAMREAFYSNMSEYRQALQSNTTGGDPWAAALPLLREAGMNTTHIRNISLSELERRVSIAYSVLFSKSVKNIEDQFKSLPGFRSISIEVIGPTLSAQLVSDSVKVVLLSLVLSAGVVFAYFRRLVPGLAVIAGAVADVIFGLGAMAFFRIPLSLHTLATLLMLLGFSLDTDILLTSKVLSKGDPKQNASEAMSTGLVMSGTTLLAFVILAISGYLTKIPIYFDMGVIASMGLVGDLIFTWLFNAVILLWVIEK